MRNPGKSALHKQFRRARAQMSVDERNAATETINRLPKPYIKRGQKIGVYWSMGKELRLDGFVRAVQKRGAKPYLPYIEPHTRRMWFTPYPADGARQEHKRGCAKLHVPQFTDEKTRVHQLSLLLIPIVDIDKRGYRLGQAGGYYNATPSATKYRLQTQTLGVGFGCQLTDTLPTESYDIPLNDFISELGVLKFRRRR